MSAQDDHGVRGQSGVVDRRARTFGFIAYKTAYKTMYGGKLIAEGDTVFVFASENEGGQGLVGRDIVTDAPAIAKNRGIPRQTPRVSITIRRTACEAATGAQRAQASYRLERRSAWD